MQFEVRKFVIFIGVNSLFKLLIDLNSQKKPAEVNDKTRDKCVLITFKLCHELHILPVSI